MHGALLPVSLDRKVAIRIRARLGLPQSGTTIFAFFSGKRRTLLEKLFNKKDDYTEVLSSFLGFWGFI